MGEYHPNILRSDIGQTHRRAHPTSLYCITLSLEGESHEVWCHGRTDKQARLAAIFILEKRLKRVRGALFNYFKVGDKVTIKKEVTNEEV